MKLLRPLSWLQANMISLKVRLRDRDGVRFVNGETICGLAIILFIAIPLMGRFTAYREDSDSLFVDVLWRVAWIPFNLLPIAIVALLGLLVYRRWK